MSYDMQFAQEISSLIGRQSSACEDVNKSCPSRGQTTSSRPQFLRRKHTAAVWCSHSCDYEDGFWDVTHCGPVDIFQLYRGTCYSDVRARNIFVQSTQYPCYVFICSLFNNSFRNTVYIKNKINIQKSSITKYRISLIYTIYEYT